MARLTNKAGAVISVPAEKADRMGSDWEPVEKPKAPAKKSEAKKSSDSK